MGRLRFEAKKPLRKDIQRRVVKHIANEMPFKTSTFGGHVKVVDDVLSVPGPIVRALAIDKKIQIPPGGFVRKDGKPWRIVKDDGRVVFRRSVFAKYAGKSVVPAAFVVESIGEGAASAAREVVEAIAGYVTGQIFINTLGDPKTAGLFSFLGPHTVRRVRIVSSSFKASVGGVPIKVKLKY